MFLPNFIFYYPLHPAPPVDPEPSVAVRLSKFTARNPRKVLIGSLVSATLLSFIGLYVGKFKIEVDNKGWSSRGTVIADRQMQFDLLNFNKIDLFNDEDGSVWKKLQNENSEGYVEIDAKVDSYQTNEESRRERHLLFSAVDIKKNVMKSLSSTTANAQLVSKRSLAEACDGSASWHQDNEAIVESNNLFAMWKALPKEETSSMSLLNEGMMSKICESETNTLQALEDSNLCDKCGSDGRCLKPFSLIYLLREKLSMIDSSCDELMSGYATGHQSDFTNELLVCTNEYVTNFDSVSLQPGASLLCQLPSYNPVLVDYTFAGTDDNILRYSSSYFRISEQKTYDSLYDAYDDFDFADGEKLGATYDTTLESLSEVKVDLLIQSDMVSFSEP